MNNDKKANEERRIAQENFRYTSLLETLKRDNNLTETTSQILDQNRILQAEIDALQR